MKVKLITKTFPFLIRMNKNNVSLLSSLIIALKKCICKIIKTPSALEFTYKKKKGGEKKNKFTRTSTYSFAYSTDDPSLPVANILIYLFTTVSQFVTLNQGGCDIPEKQTAARIVGNLEIFGGARRDRTDDLFTASEALSQLSYSPF